MAVIEADKEIQDLLVTVLADGGFSPLPFVNGVHAIADLKPNTVDLIVAGLSMPSLTGWQLCRLLRSPEHTGWHRVPILLVAPTGLGDEAYRVTSDLGGNGLVSLENGAESLLNAARKLLAESVLAPAFVPRGENHRFRDAVRNAEAGYFLIGVDGCFQFVNEAWLRLHGLASIDNVIGRHFSITQMPGDLEGAMHVVNQVLSGIPIRAGEFRRRCSDGSIGYHTFSAHPVVEAGKVVGLEGFLIDTTALHRIEERYQTLFSRMLDGFAVHEIILSETGQPLDYRFLSVNPAFEQLVGCKASEVIGRTVEEVLTGTESEWIANYGRVATTGEPLRFESFEAKLQKHFEVVAFRSGPGQLACLLHDITQRRKNHSEIERLTRLYRVLSQVNQTIARTTSQQELFNDICRIGVEFGHFCTLWIGQLDSQSGEVTVIARQSVDEDSFEIESSHCNLFRTATRGNSPIWCNEINWSQSHTECNGEAIRSGVGSCAAFPIHFHGHVWGALCLHATDPGFFNADEVELLEEVALDVSFAMDKLDAEARQAKTEEALLRSQANLSALIDSSGDLIWSVDLDFRLVVFNEPMREHLHRDFGVDPKVGMTPDDLFSPVWARVWKRRYRRALSEGSVRTDKALQDGRTREISLHRISSNGVAIGVAVFGKDVSDRLAMVETIRQTADEYATLFNQALEGIFRVTPDGRVLSANPAFARILGYGSPEEMIAGPNWVWKDRREQERFLNCLEQDGFVRAYECKCQRRDGTYIWIRTNSRKVSGEDGRTLYYEGFVEDITERKRAEDEIREREEKFRKAFLTGADGFFIATLREGEILDVNDRFEDVFGYTREEAIGQTFSTLGIEPDFSHQKLIAELSAAGHVRDRRSQITRKGGALRSVLLSANTLAEGDRPLILGVVRDITEQELAEGERLKLEEQFRQAQKLESIGRLAGGIAHDFNNLLTVINGYAQLMAMQLMPGDPMRDSVDEIYKAGKRAADLTRQLLTFSRKQVVNPEPVDLGQLILDSRSMFRRLLGEDIELITHLAPELPKVFADPGQLHQVLMNLLVNARDAMRCGGRLILETAITQVDEADAAEHPGITPGIFVRLAVTDTGTGIPKEIQDRVFDPFFTTKAEGEGTGLGLSTVYGIVRQCGGSISISSEPDRGTTFRIYLPKMTAGAPERQAADPVADPLRGSETILLVEDQPGVRRLIAMMLKSYGYRVVEAAHGKEALLLAEHHAGSLDLLLTDVVMPGMTGKELADRLMPLRPGMKLVYISGYTADTITQRALLDPDIEFLPKPFTPTALVGKVRQVLASVDPPRKETDHAPVHPEA